MRWYQDASFGLFIHWGAYTVAGAEASWPVMAPALSEAMFGAASTIKEAEYVSLPARFNPVDFDADAWVKTAWDAGMRYMVITSKHHDGFCMFDAPGTDYKITRTPFGRDVCLELSKACAKTGMRLGFYYSPPDMHHPGYRRTDRPMTENWLGEPKRKEWAGYLDYMESHLRKLLTDYGTVSVLWFDGLCNHAKYDTPRFHKLIHELSPDTLINDRLGPDYDFITPEQFIPKAGIPVRSGKPPSSDGPESENFFRQVVALFKIPGIRGWIRKQMQKYSDGSLELTPVIQQAYPRPERFQPWETCMTMGRSWAFNPNETVWKTPRDLLRNLVAVVSRGGNYLLNVGPDDKGVFPAETSERLAHISKWMDKNSASIYGAHYTPLPDQAWGRTTRKGDTVYLHVFEWPAGGKLLVNGFPSVAKTVRMMSGDSIPFTQEGPRLVISVPEQAPDSDDSVIAVSIDATEPGWSDYPPEKESGEEPGPYIRVQAIASALINGVINGLLALYTYRRRTGIPFTEAAVDLLISVAIITFLTSWILVGSARKAIDKGSLRKPKKSKRGTWLPRNTALAGFLIALACTAGWGGLLDSLVWITVPEGFSGWGYIAFKTFYTAASGALAVFVSVKGVLTEKNSSKNL